MQIEMQHESLWPDHHEIIGTVLVECTPVPGSYTGEPDTDFTIRVTAFAPANILADLRCYHGPERRWLARRLAAVAKDARFLEQWLLANCQRVVDLYLEQSGGQQP